MAKYTDEQIKKALECCVYANCAQCDYCGDDKYQDCADQLCEDALNLINRQEAEKSELQDRIKCEEETNKHLNDEYIALLKKCNCQEAEIERLKADINIDLDRFATEYDSRIKAEAIKEFAERLKAELSFGKYIQEDQIDTLVNEMVGEGE